jgi:hypothetical protein
MREEERKKKNKEKPNQSKASKRKPNGIKDKSQARQSAYSRDPNLIFGRQPERDMKSKHNNNNNRWENISRKQNKNRNKKIRQRK